MTMTFAEVFKIDYEGITQPAARQELADRLFGYVIAGQKREFLMTMTACVICWSSKSHIPMEDRTGILDKLTDALYDKALDQTVQTRLDDWLDDVDEAVEQASNQVINSLFGWQEPNGTAGDEPPISGTPTLDALRDMPAKKTLN